MKLIFFLIPILVIGLFSFSDSYAEKGLNYDDVLISINDDGTETHQWNSAPERISINNQYVDFRFIDGADFLSVETGHGSVVLNKNTCSFDFYQKGIINGSPLFSDSIVAKIATNGTENWSAVTSVNDAACEASGNENQLVAKKYSPGVGLLEYKYINTGSKWKTQLEATNLSSLTNKKFGFTQTIDLNRDTVNYGGSEKNLDDYADTTFSRTWLENNQGRVINFLNDISFDFDIGFNNLKSINVYDTGVNKSKLSFNYLYNSQIIPPNETLIIDPTFTDTTGSDGRVYTGGVLGAACDPTFSVSDGVFNTYKQDTTGAGAGSCQVGWVVFDLSSLTGTETISSASIEFDVTVLSGTPGTCDLVISSTNTPGQQMVDDGLGTGAPAGTMAQETWDNCDDGAANGYTVSIDSSAFTEIISWAGGDITFLPTLDSWVRNAGAPDDYIDFRDDDMILTINYNTIIPPYAVTDLVSTATTGTSVALDWTAPYAGGGGQTIISYQINATTPQTSNPLVLTNSTGNTTSAWTVTGLTIGTPYSFRVSAWTNVTNGHPLNNATGNVLNVTTSMPQIVCCAPVLTAGSSSVTSINLSWTASTLQNLRGYKIERETPTGSGWSQVTANTTNTLLAYNDSPLTSNILYNYRIYGLNGTGQSTVSNTKEMTTFHKPNAVTPLTATADSFSQILLAWTAPTSYAPAIVDYMINYTTPYGSPTTIIIHSPNVTSPAYTVTGLTIGSPYSFRVSAVTIHGSNATGQIANATTSTVFDPSNLSDPDTTNTDDFKIFYTETITNATSILLDVTYPGSFTLTCNMLHKFSGDNNTYTGLTETATTNYGNDTGTVKSSFRFNGANTEIINVNCYNGTTTTGEYSAKYIVTIRDFELLQQIANFRNGTYGTTGQFGGIDLITLLIVIIGMIGFNRVTPIAGVVFTIITVGVAAHFGIIAYYQIMFPALALIVLLAYTRTRQTDG